MSSLYGSLKGARKAVTRTGSKNSGMKASLQSWEGSLISYMDYDSEGKKLQITLGLAGGSSSISDEIIFSGTLEELKNKLSK